MTRLSDRARLTLFNLAHSRSSQPVSNGSFQRSFLPRAISRTARRGDAISRSVSRGTDTYGCTPPVVGSPGTAPKMVGGRGLLLLRILTYGRTMSHCLNGRKKSCTPHGATQTPHGAKCRSQWQIMAGY